MDRKNCLAVLVVAAIVYAVLPVSSSHSEPPACPGEPQKGEWHKDLTFEPNPSLDPDGRRTCTQRFTCSPPFIPGAPNCHQVETAPKSREGLCRTGDHASRGENDPCDVCFLIGEPAKECYGWLEKD